MAIRFVSRAAVVGALRTVLEAAAGAVAGTFAALAPRTGTIRPQLFDARFAGRGSFQPNVNVSGSWRSTLSAATGAFLAQIDDTAPSVPTALQVTVISDTEIDLSWAASTDVESGIAGYRIYRGPTLATLAFIRQVTTLNAADTGLTPWTTYYYGVSAIDRANNESIKVTAGPYRTLDLTAPSVPTNLAGVGVSETGIDLTWTASTDSASGVASYDIWRGGAKIGSSTTPSYADRTCTAYTLYNYAVRALDAAGNQSNLTAGINVRALDLTAPSVPSGLAATPIATNQIDLAWAASSDTGSGVANYEVYRGAALLATQAGRTYSDSGLAANTQYSYQILAIDAAGNRSAKCTAVLATTLSGTGAAPDQPSAIFLGPVTDFSIKFCWWPPTSGDVGLSYEVERSDIAGVVASGVVPALVGDCQIPQLYYSEGASSAHPPAASTDYTYRVWTVRNGVRSLTSAQLPVRTLDAGPGATLPAPPTDPNTFMLAAPASYPVPSAACTHWKVSLTAGLNAAGTKDPNNNNLSQNCGVQYAFDNCARAGGDVIVVPVGAVTSGTMPSYTVGATLVGPAWTYVISSEDPVYKAQFSLGVAKLIAYSFDQDQDHRTAYQLVASPLPAIGATSATLAAAWAGRTAYYDVYFYSDILCHFETRLCHFTNGSRTITWELGFQQNPVATGQLKGNVISATILVHEGNYATWDDLANLGNLQWTTGGNTGSGLEVYGSYIRFIGIGVMPAPNQAANRTSTSGVSVFGDHVLFDRCIVGRDTGTAAWSPLMHGFNFYGTNNGAHQCAVYGVSGGVPHDTVAGRTGWGSSGDCQAVYFGANGPHCVRNSYAEATSENFFSGGGWCAQNRIPHDITIEHNFSNKNGAWNGSEFACYVKNHLEFKLAQRVHIHRNLIQNCYWSQGGAGQNGRAIVVGALDQVAGQATRWNQNLTWANGVVTVDGAYYGMGQAVGTKWTATVAGVGNTLYNGTFEITITQAYNGSYCQFQYALPGANPGPCGTNGTGTYGKGSTTTNQMLMNPWTCTTDFNVEYNKIWDVATGIYFNAGDGRQPGYRTGWYRAAHNEVWINPAAIGLMWSGIDSNGNAGQVVSQAACINLQCNDTPNVTVEHNTFISIPSWTGYLRPEQSYGETLGFQLYTVGPAANPTPIQGSRYVIRDNLIDSHNAFKCTAPYGGAWQGDGPTAIAKAFKDGNAAWQNNVTTLDARAGYPNPPAGGSVATYTQLFGAGVVDNTRMPNPAEQWLVTQAPWATGATDGGPIGCDFLPSMPTSLPSATVGTAYSNSLPAAYAWNIEQAFPAYGKCWYLDGATLKGTPQMAGTDTLILRGTDSVSHQTTTVSLGLVNTVSGALSFASPTALPNATVNGAYGYQLIAAGGVPPYRWSMTSGPATFACTTNGWLEGCPTAAGSNSIGVRCEDNVGTAVTATVTVAADTVLKLAGIDWQRGVINLPPAHAGQAYSYTFRKAYGGTGAGQTFAIASGALPAGLALSSAGVLSGTPTYSGNTSFAVRVTDGGSNTDTRSIHLNVSAAYVGTRPAGNTGSGYFVDTVGNICKPNGSLHQIRGLNRNHYDHGNSYPQTYCNSVRYWLYTLVFRGSGGVASATYFNRVNSEHVANGIFPIVTSPIEAATGVNLTGGTAPATVGHQAAWWADNYALWNSTGLDVACAINPANEWGPAGGTNWANTYKAVSAPITSVSGTTIHISGATNAFASAVIAGWVYIKSSSGITDGAYQITGATGGSAGDWTITLSSSLTGTGGTLWGGVIGIMRAAGYKCPIVIDCADYGQGRAAALNYGVDVAASDPQRNIVLSHHIYGQTTNFVNQIAGVTCGSTTVVRFNGGATHPWLQPAQDNGTTWYPSQAAKLSGLSGALGTMLNGNSYSITARGGSQAAGWTLTLSVNTTGQTYSGGGVITDTWHYYEWMSNGFLPLKRSGLAIIQGEYGTSTPPMLRGSGHVVYSPTLVTAGEVTSAAEALGIGIISWAWDDNTPGPVDSWFILQRNSGTYAVPADLTFPIGLGQILNPRFGISTLSARPQ